MPNVTNDSSSIMRRMAVGLGGLAGTLVLLAAAAYVFTSLRPALGARAVDMARGLLGDKIVSQVENSVLRLEDKAKQLEYRLAKPRAAAPWQAGPPASVPPAVTASATNAAEAAAPTRLPADVIYPGASPSATPANLSSTPATPSPRPAAWRMEDVPPLGTAPEEGRWTAYLRDATGVVVAYRTFLQPDPERPYASVAVVAFDLQATRLHFVPGYTEPVSAVFISRPARIPAGDLLPGKILAAFNGGFKAEHGHFGVMVAGVILIPPRDGFGTVAIDADGKVALGAWGKDISASPGQAAWRQNGPLIIQEGQINPHTAVTDPKDWGYTTDGGTATGRSALGISPDGRVLYYAAGFDLTLPALSRAVQEAGAWQAIQLDINNFYAHFEAFSMGSEGKLAAVPLLDQMKGPGDQRYLTINSRDFFYVTTK